MASPKFYPPLFSDRHSIMRRIDHHEAAIKVYKDRIADTFCAHTPRDRSRYLFQALDSYRDLKADQAKLASYATDWPGAEVSV